MLKAIAKHMKLIISWGLIFAVLSAIVCLVWPKQYSATSEILIISRDRTGVDPYTQAKAAERTGANLAQVIQTTDFYKKVMENTAVAFDRERWTALTERKQRKTWVRDVRADMVYNSSLMSITAYSPTAADALALSQAVSETAVARGWEYVGGDVLLKTVNAPLASRLPARPNIPVNVALGFVVGILVASLWVVKYHHHSVFGD